MTESQFAVASKLKNKIKAVGDLKTWILSEDKTALLTHYTEINFKFIKEELLSALYKMEDELYGEFDKL